MSGKRSGMSDDEIVACMKRVLFLDREELVKRVGSAYFTNLGIPNYAYKNEHTIRVMVTQTRRIMALTRATDRHVLEVGCGIGLNAIITVLAGASRVTALDFLAPQIEVMRRMIAVIDEPVLRERLTVVCGDATKMDFPDDSFDVIEIMDMLSHCQDLDALVVQVRRVARPGAAFYVLDGNNALKLGAAKEIAELQETAERGPLDQAHAAGRCIGIPVPYVETRARMIRERFPQLDDATIRGFADETSGLYGEEMLRTVARRVAGEPVTVQRPTFPDVCVGKPLYRNPENGMWPEVAFSPPKLGAYLTTHGCVVRVIPYRHTVFRGGVNGWIKRVGAIVFERLHPIALWIVPGFELLGRIEKPAARGTAA